MLTRQSGICDIGAISISSLFSENDINVAEWIKPPETFSDDDIDDYLKRLKERGRSTSRPSGVISLQFL